LARRICSIENASGELLLLSPAATVQLGPPGCAPPPGLPPEAPRKPDRCGDAGAVLETPRSQPASGDAVELLQPPPPADCVCSCLPRAGVLGW